MSKKKSDWSKVIDFFNAQQPYKIVRRKEFIVAMKKKGVRASTDRNYTVDTYRLYLERAGYIGHYDRGKYALRGPIYTSLTLRACKRLAYGK